MPNKEKKEHKKETPVAGNPVYGEKDDIYNREKKIPLEEEEFDTKKKRVQKTEESAATGLDVPGAELDDANEKIGEEDEENNYYSIGGDNHNNLDEHNED